MLTSKQTVFDFHEIGFSVAHSFGNALTLFADLIEFEWVSLPIVVLKVAEQFLAGFVVLHYRVYVVFLVAVGQFETRHVRVQRLR
jgi:hypothetical protein